MPPRILIIIPARYASTRYPAKPLVEIKGANGVSRTLIERSWRAASAVPGVSAVAVATDDARIADKARSFGADVIMTSPDCANGTERCAEAVTTLAAQPDIVINLQGDAPLTPVPIVSALIARMKAADVPQVATPAVRCSPTVLGHLQADQAQGRVGGTTMVFDEARNALYFSKRIIPYLPAALSLDAQANAVHLHMGLYAYTPAALRAYRASPACGLEQLEGLEQLRFLHAGIKVAAVVCDPPSIDPLELNNPADLAQIEAIMARHGLD